MQTNQGGALAAGHADFTVNNTKKILNVGPAFSTLTPYAQTLVPNVNDPTFTFPYGASLILEGINGAAFLSVMEGTTDGTSAGEAGNVFSIGHYPTDSTFGTGGWNTNTYNAGAGISTGPVTLLLPTSNTTDQEPVQSRSGCGLPPTATVVQEL